MQTNTWTCSSAAHADSICKESAHNWDGTNILVHHVSNTSASRVSCGAAGHMRTTCTGTDDFWRLHRSITVTAEQFEMLPRQQSTITSLDELEQLWVEDFGKRYDKR
ncbi:hypothetical protein GQ600_8762 [Phytophthora cactorum]|nr:hypothetical protein GQ600_8762 [Phytophthora cactorum]